MNNFSKQLFSRVSFRLTLSTFFVVPLLTASKCEEFELDEDAEEFLLEQLKCHENETQTCLCTDNSMGVQMCLPDAGTWDLCICPKPCDEATVELCDGLDNNCDGLVDNNAVDAPLWYADKDNDGFGNNSAVWRSCEKPVGYVAPRDTDDCVDTDSSIYPGQVETCGDDIDANCNGFADEACH